MKKYLFIDRDGTLIHEPAENKQVDRLDKIALEVDVIPSLLALKACGYRLIMVTNQDGLGTESFPQEDFDAVHRMVMQLFTSQGVTFEEVLICPHRPKDNCDCRKPKTQLLARYLGDPDWSRERSFVIGDRDTDIQLANNIGVRGLRYDPNTADWTAITQQILGNDRHAKVRRITRETSIDIELWLDREGKNQIATGIGFFDHMLDQIATHGGFLLHVQTQGDLQVDDHHTIEDTGLTLGQTLREALGEKRGIARFGFVLPMDESHAECTLDLSGRPYLKFQTKFAREKVGDMSTDMVKHFFYSLTQTLGCTLHLKAKGENTHHLVESLFKVFGRALRQAIRVESNTLPSSKGTL
ncbi:MAG: bifunctional histidinol-phosphatase/imidazoleglycerol-phosphate dehydratase HisB [Burkholderiales bacterium]|jgi:imidazoleglycerol-phosphate dehydratase/histidinol-phosphatase|nr:bifunctional histidinol-phosphatase/imidazoleglycerol-phosphate dehydratase HisB [Burkholderiales bacterium]